MMAEGTHGVKQNNPLENKSTPWLLNLIQRGQNLVLDHKRQRPSMPDIVIKEVKKRLPTEARAEELRLKSVAEDLSSQGFTEADIRNAIAGVTEAVLRLNRYRDLMNQGRAPVASASINRFFDSHKLTSTETPSSYQANSETPTFPEHSPEELIGIANEILHGINPKDVTNAIKHKDQEAISILQAAITEDALDAGTPKIKVLDAFLRENRDYTRTTKSDLALMASWLQLALGDNSKTIRQDPNLDLIRQIRLEQLMKLATESIANPNNLGRLYHELEISTTKKFDSDEYEKVIFKLDDKTYNIAQHLIDDPHHKAFLKRVYLSKQQIDFENNVTRIESLPKSVDKTFKQDLLNALNPYIDTSAEALNHLKQQIIGYDDPDIKRQLGPLEAAVLERIRIIGATVKDRFSDPLSLEGKLGQEYFDIQESKIDQELEALRQIINSSDFDLKTKTPADMLKAMQDSESSVLREMAIFMIENPQFQAVLAQLVKQEKPKADNSQSAEPDMHKDWKKLLEEGKTPEVLLESVIEPTEVAKLKQALQTRVSQLRENASDFIKNGRVKMEEASKLVIDTIKEHAPDLLRKLGKGLLVIAVVALVLLVGTMILGSMAVGSQR